MMTLPDDMRVREAINYFMHSDEALRIAGHVKFGKVLRIRFMIPPNDEAHGDMTLGEWRGRDGFIAIDDEGGGIRVKEDA